MWKIQGLIIRTEPNLTGGLTLTDTLPLSQLRERRVEKPCRRGVGSGDSHVGKEDLSSRGLRMGALTLAFGGGHFQVCGAVCFSVHSPAVQPSHLQPPPRSRWPGDPGSEPPHPLEERPASTQAGREVEGVPSPPSPRGEGGKRPHSQRDPRDPSRCDG